MMYLAWAIFLVLQNASFTFVSRARNSGSYALHALAAVCSNGVFFATQLLSFGFMLDVIRIGTWTQRLGIGAFYTVFTVFGSVLMHYISSNYIEKGKRKVGA